MRSGLLKIVVKNVFHQVDLISNGLDDVFGYHLTLFFSPRPQNCVFLVFIGQKECRLYAIKTDE